MERFDCSQIGLLRDGVILVLRPEFFSVFFSYLNLVDFGALKISRESKFQPKLTLQQNCITHERLLSLWEIFLVAFYSNLTWSQRLCLKFFFVKERACRETWNIRNRGTQRRTVFSEISVRRSKYCLEFSITWRRLKISRWQFHSCTILKAFLTNSSRFSEV